MKPLTPFERADLLDSVGRTRDAADARTVMRIAEQARAATMYGPTASKRAEAAARVLDNALPVLRRLLDVEQQLAAHRAALTRFVAAIDVGDDPTTADLLADLARNGVPLDDDEITAARALHNAQAVTW